MAEIVMRSPSQSDPNFCMSLCGIAIDHEDVKRAIACAHFFVRNFLFRQRKVFSVTGIAMLNTATSSV